MDLESLKDLTKKLERETSVSYKRLKSSDDNLYKEENPFTSLSMWFGGVSGVAVSVGLLSYFVNGYNNGMLNSVITAVDKAFPFATPMAAVLGGCVTFAAVSGGIYSLMKRSHDKTRDKWYKADDKEKDVKQILNFVENNKVKEYLSEKELEKFKKDDRYLVIDLSECSVHRMNDVKDELDASVVRSHKNKMYALDIISRKVDEEISHCSLLVESDYIGINERAIVVDKKSANMEMVCSEGKRDSSLYVVKEYDLSSVNDKTVNKLFYESVQKVDGFRDDPSVILNEVYESNKQSVDIKIPSEFLVYTSLSNKKSVPKKDGYLYLYHGSDENQYIVLQDKVNSIERTEDGGCVLHLRNPVTMEKDKAVVQNWMEFCKNEKLSDCVSFRLNDYKQFNDLLRSCVSNFDMYDVGSFAKENNVLKLTFDSDRFSVKVPLKSMVENGFDYRHQIPVFSGIVKKSDLPLEVETKIFKENLLVKDMDALKDIVVNKDYSKLDNVPSMEMSVPKSGVSIVDDDGKKMIVFNHLRHENSGVRVDEVKEMTDENGNELYKIKYKPLQTVSFNTTENNQKVYHTMRIYENKNLDFLVKKNIEEGQKVNVKVVKNEKNNVR